MKKYTYIWGALLLLAAATLACSLGRKTVAPPPSPSPAAPATVAPSGRTATPAPTEEAPPPALSSDVLEQLNSYRSRYVWRQTVEDGSTETVTLEVEETREPAAQRMVITSEGGNNPGTVEMVRIGDMAWICAPDSGCFQTQMSDTATPEFGEAILFTPDELSISDYRYVGQDTVNGVRSRHYILTLPPEALMGKVQGSVTATQADVWIADGAGLPAYVTRFTLSWEGTNDEGKKIRGDWTWEIYDVNQPITIQPPEGAPTQPEDIPIYPGATSQSLMGNTIMFSSTDPVEKVAEFYRAEMPRQGWAAGEENAMGSIVLQEWTKGDRQVSLMISAQDEGGCSVVITIEQP